MRNAATCLEDNEIEGVSNIIHWPHIYVVVVSFPDPPGWPGNETNIVAVNPFEF